MHFCCWGYQAWLLGALAYKFRCPKGSLEFILEHSLDLCSCLLFYINRGTYFSSGPSTLGWRSPKDSHWKNCRENPGPLLRKLRHKEATPFKKFMTNLRKWKKLTHVPRFPTPTVKPKATETKHKCSFVREVCVVFFPTWSLMQLPTQFLEFWWFRMLSWVRSFLATSGNVYDNSRLSDDIHRGSQKIHDKWLHFTCPSST